MKILLVGSFLPWPLDSGDPLRVATVAAAVVEASARTGAEACIAMVRRPDSSDRDVSELSAHLGLTVETFRRSLPHLNGRVGRAAPWLVGLPLGIPGWILERFSLRLAAHIRREGPDVLVLQGEAAGIYASFATRAKVVWDKSNVIGYSSDAFLVRKSRMRRSATTWVSRRYERAILRRATRVSVTSTDEGLRLEELYSRRPDAVIPSSVDLPARSAGRSRSLPRRIGWLGSLSYAANLDGLLTFLDTCWQSLYEGGATLEVVGSGAIDSDTREKLTATPGVSLLGYLPDLDAWISNLRLGVVPLRAGAGVKLKTITLMSYGVPVVGTREAFEGLGIVDGHEGFVCDSIESMGARVATVLAEGDEVSTSVGEAGADLVARSFSNLAVRRSHISNILDVLVREPGSP